MRLSAWRHAPSSARGAALVAIRGAAHGASGRLSAIMWSGIATSALAAVIVTSDDAIDGVAPLLATCSGVVARIVAWLPQPNSAVVAHSIAQGISFVMVSSCLADRKVRLRGALQSRAKDVAQHPDTTGRRSGAKKRRVVLL